MNLKFSVQAKIQKPVEEVFEAVNDPKSLSAYFTTGGASGPFVAGATLTWGFAEFPGNFPVFVKKVVPNELIVYEWSAVSAAGEPQGYNTQVEIRFTRANPGATLVTISESGWKENQVGLDCSYGNCYGWTQMLCSLKAYVEYGINLRKGFF